MTLFSPSPLSICFSGNLIGKSLQMGTAEWHVGHLLWASITPTRHITPPHFLIPSSAFRSSPSPQLLCPSLGTAGLAEALRTSIHSLLDWKGPSGTGKGGVVGTWENWDSGDPSSCPSLVPTSLCGLEQVTSTQWNSVSLPTTQEQRIFKSPPCS